MGVAPSAEGGGTATACCSSTGVCLFKEPSAKIPDTRFWPFTHTKCSLMHRCSAKLHRKPVAGGEQEAMADANKREGLGPSVGQQEALDFHATGRPGKLEVNPTKPMATQRDLSLAYSPGVAAPVKAIAEDPGKAFDYT